jgi:hypothetical protein
MMDLIEIIPAALVDPLAPRVRRLLGETFFNDAAVDYYAHLGVPETVLLLCEGEEVAGHLALYRRAVGILDHEVEIGMIGGVGRALHQSAAMSAAASIGRVLAAVRLRAACLRIEWLPAHA